MTRARDISKIVTDANLSGTLDVTGAFTSQGIDDNADATAITIDSSERVALGRADASYARLSVTNGYAYINEDGSNTNQIYIRSDYGGDPAIQVATSHALKFATGNQERMRVTSGGNVGIGTSSPSQKLHVYGGGVLIDNGSSAGTIYFHDTTNYINLSGDALQFANNGSEAMRIDSSQRVLIGHTSSVQVEGTMNLQLIGTSSNDGLSIARFNADFGPYFNFGRSGSGTIGSMTAVPNNDELGRIQWAVADGTDMNSVGASISAFTEQTAASNDVPSRLVFSTTADGASSPTERMRIDSAGDIFIGTSSDIAPANGTNLYISDGTISRIGLEKTGSDARKFSINNGGAYFSVYDETADAERMRIDSSGRVGIGTSSLSATLDIVAPANTEPLKIKATTNGYNYITHKNAAGTDVAYTGLGGGAAVTTGAFTDYAIRATANLLFGAGANTERMRINSSGTLLWSSTTAVSSSVAGISFTNSTHPAINISGGSDTAFRHRMTFINGNGTVGIISTSGTSTAYATSSDHRLKENVTADWDATTRLKQLNPVRFNFIADADTTVDGFLAHEVQSVVPEAITGTHNEVEVWKDGEELPNGVSVGDNKLDEDGNTIPVYQGIDQAKLVPLLVKTIQELEARITALEAN